MKKRIKPVVKVHKIIEKYLFVNENKKILNIPQPIFFKEDPISIEKTYGSPLLNQLQVENQKKIADDVSLDGNTRAQALFKLGRAYLFNGQSEAAFSYYSMGNDLMPHVRKNGRLPVPDLNKIRRINALFLEKIPGWPHQQINQCKLCPAVIIAGLPRTGKSLTEILLSRLPGIISGGELALARKFVSREEAIERSFEKLVHKFTNPNLLNLETQYQALIANSNKPDAKLITDTSPGNIYKLGLFSLAYPTTPIIFCERDLLDLGISIYFKKFRKGHNYSYNLATLGTTIAAVECLIDHWQKTLPNPMLRIRYEDLVSRPRDVVDELAKFMNVPLSTIERERLFCDLFHPTNYQACNPSLNMKQVRSITPMMVGFANEFANKLLPLRFSYAITRQFIK